jgi:hypothetical protein
MVGLPDFEWAARKYMNTSAYTYYRNGAAGEWSYRNNLEIFSRYRLRPRVMTDITNIESTLRYEFYVSTPKSFLHSFLVLQFSGTIFLRLSSSALPQGQGMPTQKLRQGLLKEPPQGTFCTW